MSNDRERIVREMARKRDAARASLLAQHRKLAAVRERNRQRADARKRRATDADRDGDGSSGDDAIERAGRPSARDDVPGSWSSVPERPPTRADTPTAPHRARLYGHRLRRRAERGEDDE